MRIFILPALAIVDEKFDEAEMWDIDELDAISNKANECKSQIDEPYALYQKKWDKYTRQMEPSNAIKLQMIKKFKPQSVTNAFLKLIEMNAKFNLIKDVGDVRFFDNASAPGAFIMAANYWVTTMTPNKLDWVASSLISDDDNSALGDSYGLARLHPHRFATYETKFNGDTTNVPYLRYIKKKYGNTVDTYVSDLGMHVGDGEYHMQEAINAKGNMGQVLMGLLVLKKGGNFLTKQYTHYSAFTVSLMAIISMCFEKTYIVKPMTSKSDNSEEYIIGKKFKGAPQVVLDIMFDRLEQSWEIDRNARNFTVPILPSDQISDEFKDAIIIAANELVDQQCDKINANLKEFARMIKSGDEKPSNAFMNTHVYKNLDNWFKIAKFKRMNKRSYLRTTSLK